MQFAQQHKHKIELKMDTSSSNDAYLIIDVNVVDLSLQKCPSFNDICIVLSIIFELFHLSNFQVTIVLNLNNTFIVICIRSVYG